MSTLKGGTNNTPLIFFVNITGYSYLLQIKKKKKRNTFTSAPIVTQKREREIGDVVVSRERSAHAIGGSAIRGAGGVAARPSDWLRRLHRRRLRRRRRHVQVQAQLLARSHILRPIRREYEEHRERSQASHDGYDVSFSSPSIPLFFFSSKPLQFAFEFGSSDLCEKNVCEARYARIWLILSLFYFILFF